MPDAGDAITYRDARKAFAVVEGDLPDAGDAVRNRDALQAGAVVEGRIPDTVDAIRDDVIGTCLACGISMQQRLIFIE